MFGPAIPADSDVAIISPIDRVKYVRDGWRILTSPRTSTLVKGVFHPSIMVAYKDKEDDDVKRDSGTANAPTT